jgi:hypothetical protein
MRTPKTITWVAFIATIFIVAGCDQNNQSNTSGSGETSKETGDRISAKVSDLKESAQKTATEVKESAQQAATEVKQAAEKVATDVRQTAEQTTASAKEKLSSIKTEAQNLIEKTTALINDQKYQDALNSLKQLSNLSLTPEQQATVNELKAKLEKLMSSQVVTNTASAINNLLKK